jgi:hypothetical protein
MKAELVPDWMSAEELSLAFRMLENLEEPQLIPEQLEKLSQDDWENLILAYQYLMWAKEHSRVH